MTRVVLSYWKSVEGLHAFARGPAHREGWNWWSSTVHEHPHLGIMHEVYAAPPGAWENINVNFVPFGIGELWLSSFFQARIYLAHRRNKIHCQNCGWNGAEDHPYQGKSEGVEINAG